MSQSIEEIKRMFIISFIASILGIILILITRNYPVLFGFGIGALTSQINAFILLRDTHGNIYHNYKGRFAQYSSFTKRFMIITISLFIVGYFSSKFFETHAKESIVAAGVGLLVFKLAVFINLFFKKLKR